MLAAATATAAIALSVLGVSLAARGQAQTATQVEVSNSCAVLNTAPTLTIWGSHVASGAHTLRSDHGQPSWLPPTQVTPDSLGNFKVTVVYQPTDSALDHVLLDDSPGPAINVVPPGQCPTSTPPVSPCFAPTAPVALTVGGLSSPNRDVPLSTATWNLDYPGAALALAPLATSAVTDGSTAATLTPNRATPGPHTITVIARSDTQSGALIQFEYWTYPITICQPPPGSTTTAPATTTTVARPTSTTIRRTTTTQGPKTTTTTSVPVTTTTLGAAPVLSISPTVASTGAVTQVQGSGFPPNSAVILEWQPGIGIVTAQVGPDGRFTVPFLVMPSDQTGTRLVHASGFGGTVSAALLVERGPSSAAGPFVFRLG